ncbi:MAG: hypothetical protein A2927_02850 [Candidatus Komeilibacteria bacterium RIFCSPLOWO2_01_FULL_45_10]|uniref:Clp R domain-containing protein n=1 Tax=Candidatus Komeilibacteria bacterium RIFCSPLOWO2_01_FULL_45_10 TaxID=1798550 RepID=A0A1G2BKK9_9BACT|nr:MAG: hypothetical protein A2927_02850 [Candidatus Komeilibacteria bacterium RIFCSPLOWO2_01_FULL_45_10]
MSQEQKTEHQELEGHTLIWQRRFSPTAILIREISGFLRAILRIASSAFGLYGLYLLLNHLWLIQQSGLSFFEAKAWQTPSLSYFWWSLLGLTYLFYSFGLAAGKNFRVLKKSFGPLKKKRAKKINVAESFHGQALKTIDRAYLKAVSQKKLLDHYYLFHQLFNQPKVRVVFARLGLPWKPLKVLANRLLSRSANLDAAASRSAIVKVFFDAYFFAYQAGRKKVMPIDLLVAAVLSSPLLQEVLVEFNLTADKVANVVKWLHINETMLERYKHFRAKATYKPKGAMDRAMTALATPVLDSFSDDLTSLARAGYLPLSVAREKELAEIFNIIEGGRNSVVLVGLAGVGKTNIIDGLANLMVAEEVPKTLKDKRLVSLSIPRLVAGAARPGVLEERLMLIAREVLRARNVILHVDDIHNLVGTTSVSGGNVELGEMFAEILTKKGIILIATTTPADYKQYLENHPLGQALQKVLIEEPDDNRAILMVEAKAGYLEGKNQVFLSYGAIEKAVVLSRRFIPDHYLPDKAIILLEETATAVRQEKGKNSLVSGEDVAGVIAHKTGIPLTQITQSETEKLLNLEPLIHQRMVDQEEAVNLVASALRRARAELRDTKRPIVNLLFLGPTGVGKTELAKTVAQIYFGSEDKMIRLDMSEYQLKENLNRLIGSGNEERGILTEAVRKSPFALVLLDEIEKAHPDILNLFLQVMDDGRLTDALGRTVDFGHTIIIATSNAGTQFIQDNLRSGKTLEEVKNQLLLSELKQHFKPEFLNRFDGIVVFKPLSQADIEKITYLMLAKVKKRLADKGISLEVTEAAVKELAKIGFDPAFGARPLRRAIQERVDSALANYLLTGKIGPRDKVILEEGGGLRIEKARKF